MSTTFRTTISIDGAVAEAAERAADTEKRSFSQLCEMALLEYAPVAAQIKGSAGSAVSEIVREAQAVGVDVVAVLTKAKAKACK